MPERATLAFRVFCGLLGAGVACIAFAAVVAIASGGYQPEVYAGGFDPIRAGFVLAMTAFAVAFALVLGAQLLAWFRDGDRPELAAITFAAGLALGSATAAVLMATMPAGPSPVPGPLRIAIFASLGLIVFAMASGAVTQFIELVRGRDWFEAVLWLVGAAFLIALIVTAIRT